MDEDTGRRVRAILAHAAARGADPVRVLNDHGFLLHPAVRKQIEDTAAVCVAEWLEEASVDQLLGRKPHTLLDLKRQIVKLIEERVV